LYGQKSATPIFGLLDITVVSAHQNVAAAHINEPDYAQTAMCWPMPVADPACRKLCCATCLCTRCRLCGLHVL